MHLSSTDLSYQRYINQRSLHSIFLHFQKLPIFKILPLQELEVCFKYTLQNEYTKFHVSSLILLICYINAMFFTRQIVHPKQINFQRKKKNNLPIKN